MGPGPTKVGNLLASAKMNMLRKRALRLDKKIKQSGLTPEQSKKVAKMDKRFGKAVEKYDQIMQRIDPEYGAEMRGETTD